MAVPGEGWLFDWFDPGFTAGGRWHSRFWDPVGRAQVLPIAEGEDIGIVDYSVDVPVGGASDAWFPGLIDGAAAVLSQVASPAPDWGTVPEHRRSDEPLVMGGLYIPPADDEEPTSTDWDRAYEEFVELNPYDEMHIPGDYSHDEFTQQGDEHMPSIWDVIGGVADIFDDEPVPTVYSPQQFTGGVNVPYTGPTSTGNGVEIDPKTGKVKCKRRRRRRMLTESDFNDLMRISTLPNKENVRIALAKAIGRRG